MLLQTRSDQLARCFTGSFTNRRICSIRKQQLREFVVATEHRFVQCRLTVPILSIDSCSGVKQQASYRNRTSTGLRQDVKRCNLIVVARVYIGAGLQQQFGNGNCLPRGLR